MAKKSFKFYDVRHLLKEYPEAYYYLVMGERSNGKTYSALDYALEKYFKSGEQFAYIRRFGEDIRKKQLSNLFSAHIENERISTLSGGEWSSVDYTGNKFRLARSKEDGTVEYGEEPIGFAFDLNSMEHYKSISFPKVTTVIFDEFLSRQSYLPNEFMLFTNSLSTIVRLRKNVKIFMLGNTVNKYCPYFGEMGLTHIKEQKQGTVDVYNYSDSGLQVVVEYCASSSKHGGKESDVYFAFDNPQLQMITQGSWEIAIYPHLPVPYKPMDVIADFFVSFDNELLHGKIIYTGEGAPFVFLHLKTTPIQDEENDIVYGQEPSHLPTHRVGFAHYTDKVSKFILQCLRENRVFYATNEVGEIFRNYIIFCDSLNIRRS